MTAGANKQIVPRIKELDQYIQTIPDAAGQEASDIKQKSLDAPPMMGGQDLQMGGEESCCKEDKMRVTELQEENMCLEGMVDLSMLDDIDFGSIGSWSEEEARCIQDVSDGYHRCCTNHCKSIKNE